jgi:DNA-binding CsgD family transcriptional regulator
MVRSDTAQAVFWGERAIALAERLDDPDIVSAALGNIGSCTICAGDPVGQARLERSLAIALEHGFERTIAIDYSNLADGNAKRREHALALGYIQEGLAYCVEHDLDLASQSLQASRAQVRLDQGDWAGAGEEVAAILSIPGVSAGSRVTPLTVLGQLRARRGDPGAEAVLDELRDLALTSGEMQRIAPMAAARAEWRWLRGDLAGCAAEARVGVQAALHLQRPWHLGEVAIWLWRGGGTADTVGAVATPYALEMAGDWRGAADAWQQLGCPYEQALALADGDETAQREALALLERLGAAPAAERVRHRLRASGVRGLPRGPRPTTRANPQGLTTRQLQILRLLADGLHNSEIAVRLCTTPKTIEHHVSAVLAKLGARSRAEAVSIAHTSGLIPAPAPTTASTSTPATRA